MSKVHHKCVYSFNTNRIKFTLAAAGSIFVLLILFFFHLLPTVGFLIFFFSSNLTISRSIQMAPCVNDSAWHLVMNCNIRFQYSFISFDTQTYSLKYIFIIQSYNVHANKRSIKFSTQTCLEWTQQWIPAKKLYPHLYIIV